MPLGSTPSAGPDLTKLKIARGDGGSDTRRRGSNIWAVLLVLLLGAGAWAYFTGRLSIEGVGGARLVETARIAVPAGQSPVGGEVKGNGYVIARKRAALSTVLSGRLVELNVEEGMTVKAGQVVARIQHDDYDAALAAAKKDVLVAESRRDEISRSLAASRLDRTRIESDIDVLRDLVKQAEADADRAAAEAKRKQELHDKRLIDDNEWDRVQAQASMAASARDAARKRVLAGTSAEIAWDGEISRREAALATAEAEIAKSLEAKHQAEVILEKTFVRAPFDGLVVHKDAEVGEVVAATGAGGNSRGSVATIIDPTTLEVQVEMAETRLGTISQGDPVRIRLDADGSNGPSYPGTVRQVWPTADRQKATVELRIVFTERPPVLKPEMGVTVAFVSKETAERASKPPEPIRVPKSAVVLRDGHPVVFVVSGGIAKEVVVKTGPEQGDVVTIASGLLGGETVVLDAPAGLKDGDKVRTKEAP